MTDELYAVDQLGARVFAALDAETHNRSLTVVAELGKGLSEECPCSAVKAGGRNEILPGMDNGRQRRGDRSLATRKRQSSGTSIQCCKPLLQHMVVGFMSRV